MMPMRVFSSGEWWGRSSSHLSRPVMSLGSSENISMKDPIGRLPA